VGTPIIHILLMGAVFQVAQPVVAVVTVDMSAQHPLWCRANESLQNQLMDAGVTLLVRAVATHADT